MNGHPSPQGNVLQLDPQSCIGGMWPGGDKSCLLYQSLVCTPALDSTGLRAAAAQLFVPKAQTAAEPTLQQAVLDIHASNTAAAPGRSRKSVKTWSPTEAPRAKAHRAETGSLPPVTVVDLVQGDEPFCITHNMHVQRLVQECTEHAKRWMRSQRITCDDEELTCAGANVSVRFGSLSLTLKTSRCDLPQVRVARPLCDWTACMAPWVQATTSKRVQAGVGGPSGVLCQVIPGISAVSRPPSRWDTCACHLAGPPRSRQVWILHLV